MLKFIAGVLVGSITAIVWMCMVITGKRADEGMERYEQQRKGKPLLMDKRNCICFVNSQQEELFCIPDGGCIELVSGDGARQISICRYLDVEHATIDGIRWQMAAFAVRMEERGITYAPILN